MILIVQHKVRDFDAWKSVFEEHGDIRRKYGATGHELYQTIDDPNDVVILNTFASLDQARAFAADPSLKQAMEQGGVIGEPHITWAEEVEKVHY
jgi:heme-degrading monooxygenase HmoA